MESSQSINSQNNVDLSKYLPVPGISGYFYTLYKSLGRGTYGAVYQGVDISKSRKIAVKIIKLDPFDKEEQQKQLRQIQALQSLKHSNVMEIYYSHILQEQLQLFIVAELCAGGNLTNHIIKKRPSEAQSISLFRQLVEGMIYVNTQGFFHRDLKPANLLVTQDGKNIKICDFGTAKTINIAGKQSFRVGTPIYIAPEVFLNEQYLKLGGQYSQKCDVFSAGYILYELLTGERFTKGITQVNQIANFLRQNIKKGGFTIEHPALAPRWVQLLKKMLNFDSEKRPGFIAIKNQLNSFDKIQYSLPKDRVKQTNFSKKVVEWVRQKVQQAEHISKQFLNILKVISANEHAVSSMIPRVYKLLMIYLSLAQYCKLAEEGLKYLNSPQKIIYQNGQLLYSFYDRMVGQDKAELLQFVEKKAVPANKAVQQIRYLMITQIIPELETLLKASPNDPERQVIVELLNYLKIQNYRKRIYQSDYIKGLHLCMGALYQTEAELQTMDDIDLLIYLVMLQTSLQNKRMSLETKQRNLIGSQLKIWKIQAMGHNEVIDNIVCWQGLLSRQVQQKKRLSARY